ncbi:MAG: hypothetical protein AAF434_10605 [Pseudomonadota bacterium]
MRKLVSSLLAFCLLVICGSAFASSASLRVAGSFPDYSLDIATGETALEFDPDADEFDLRFWKLGISLAEEVIPGLKVRLGIGHLGLSLDDRDQAAGLDPGGNYVKLSLDGLFGVSDSLAVGTALNYQYWRADDESSDGDEIDYQIDVIDARLSAIFHVSKRVSLEVGGLAFAADGRERYTTGGLRETTQLESASSSGALVNAIFHVGRSGRVDLTALFGAQNVLSISFRREY